MTNGSDIMSSPVPAWLNRFLNVLAERGIADVSTVQGCTEAEIDEVAQGRSLPLRYREFLQTMGRGSARLGGEGYYPSIIGLTADGAELVAEDSAGIVLPADALVISMCQGYQFLFLRSGEGDDPPVWYYMENSGRFDRKFDSFTGYLSTIAGW